MQHTTDDIDELIGKYLAGEATAEEAARIEAWEHASEANVRYMHQFRTIFDKACTVKTLQTFDTDAAWNNLQRKMRSQQGTTEAPARDNVRTLHAPAHRNLYLRIAASVLILLGVGYLAYRVTNTTDAIRPVTVIADGQTVADTLPDGSDVYLNKQTKLVYAYDRKKQIHTVKLKGEAYFSINHEDAKKFIVDVGDVFIRDIGTRFNVTAYEESNTVEVVVVEGEVEFFTKGDSGVRLQAGGKGVYNRTTKTFSIEKPDSNALAYKTRVFSFSNTPLGEAVAMLNEVYDQKIVIGKNLESCPLNVIFSDEDIDEIALIIAGTFGLTVNETGDTLTLEGHGCNP
ncbi:FecR domain-containing protein [Fulvivirgaceae bacterium PWU5]|uniref:FecR domain-containing protein n=1 Tax=Dawidia cretensis TaxID=2782350 RepID=A0AAP2E467_9BACT|nr:FecR domain-containing protein [Dawidia cretensis]MBT1712240.1 FecR domain-containing protein [Dawidia cretensis]